MSTTGPAQTWRVMAQSCYDAIVKILAGTLTSYSSDGRSYTKHNLSQLNELAKEYERKANAAELGGSFRTAADFSSS
jgi:hypothetical protein